MVNKMKKLKFPKEIEIPAWIGHGTGMMRRRDCLPADHPQSEYNYVLKTYGVDPTLYGIKEPGPRCKECGHLLDEEY